MRIKLDENLPAGLAEALAELGHDADTVRDEGLSGRSDDEVWKVTQQAGRFLITQDLDFSDLRAFAPGTHHGILLLRMADASRRSLIERTLSIFQAEDVDTWVRCFVVATQVKVRVRRPTGGSGD